ncbi:MAG: hypothetical protein RBR35_00755 [Salinivirgaceae bacterium]|nr:hypothetical protein [Salinivirgaceae bacterium]
MKKTFIIAFAMFLGTATFAQKEAVSESYDRSAITMYLLDYDANKYQRQTVDEFQIVKMQEKFDDNELSTRILDVRSSLGATVNHEAKIKAIIEKIAKDKLVNQVIAKWFDRKEDGTMGVKTIQERGLYNADDQDVITAGNTKRGMAAVMDMGMTLINKSYFHIVDFADIKSHTDLGLDPVKERHGWQAIVNGYLFKINLDDATMNTLYEDMWIYDEDDEATRKAKKEKFDNYEFQIVPIATVTAPALMQMQAGPESSLGKFIPQKSDEQLFKELMQKGYDRTVFLLENKVPDLRVRVNLFNDRPLEAKIGKKEALKRDQRFFIYEYIYNEETKGTDQSRKGVVRAKKVVDNRQVATGTSPMSKFYQIHGGNLEKGMLMEQKNDRGIGVQGRFHIGEIGGAGAKVTWNPNPMLNILPVSQLKVYGMVATQSKEYTGTDYSFMRLGGGITKGWYFARMFNFELGAGYVMESATVANVDGSINVAWLTFGGEVGVNALHWLRLFAGADFHAPMTNATDADGAEYHNVDGTTAAYTDFFENRTGLSINLGLSIEF